MVEELKKWGEWKRNLIYWGTDRFDILMNPTKKNLHILGSDFEVVERIEEIYNRRVVINSRKKLSLIVVVDFYVFEWSLKKISERRRLSLRRVKDLVEKGENTLVEEI